MKSFIKTLFVLAFFSSAVAHAEMFDRVELKPALVSGFVSQHINTQQKYNENNYGVGYRFGGADVIVGYYKNSEYNDSVYAAYEARWKLTEHVHVGVIAGAVTGYKRAAVLPVVLPEAVVQLGGLEVALTYAPKVDKTMPAFTAVQFRWAW